MDSVMEISKGLTIALGVIAAVGWVFAAACALGAFLIFGQLGNTKQQLQTDDAKVSQQQTTIDSLQSQLATANANNTNLQGQNSQLQNAYDQAKLPVIPITVGFDNDSESTDNGLLTQIYNASPNQVTLSVQIKGSESSDAQTINNIVLDAHETHNYGSTDGWRVHTGDVLIFSEDGHQDGQFTARVSST
jgi:hypothetical protein